MAKLDDLLKRGSMDEIRAEYSSLTGLDPGADVLGLAALSARNWVVDGRKRAGALDRWIEQAVKLGEEFPEEPTDEMGSTLLNADFLRVLKAYSSFDEQVRRVRHGLMFRSCVEPLTGGREEDTPARAFAIALVWLWKYARRKRLTPGPTALLAVTLGVDQQPGLLALGSPTRRWKNHLDEAFALVDSGEWEIHGPKTMPIHMLLIAYGGTPEAVIGILTAPGYIEQVRARQAPGNASGH